MAPILVTATFVIWSVAIWWLMLVAWLDEPTFMVAWLSAAALFMLYPGVAAAARLRYRSGTVTLIVLALAPAVFAGVLFIGDAMAKLAICQMTLGEAILTRGIPVALVGAFTLAGISAAAWAMAPGGRVRLIGGFVAGAVGAFAAGVVFFLPILLMTAGHRNPVPCG